ncbi:glycosyltransferase [Stigmatella sp. ncwal1]|uniref:Glycosyltransferase n=1 Tax=Stigmatella ashevillensis TaxID=2995309 RepID=A0ABT5DMR6_9BACT|nr:glycosyltransferase [Stigmatella ashevillena]MDC0714952.1 glycosyltransferase [Stigmatella ashevillena]
MTKDKRTQGSPEGGTSPAEERDSSVAERERIVRERRSFLEMLRQSEQENQTLRQQASALEREREHLSDLLKRAEGGAHRPGQRPLPRARALAGQFREKLVSRSKTLARPLMGPLMRATQKVRGPLEGALDSPTPDQQVGSNLHVEGWCTSATTEVESVEVWLDGHRLGRARLGLLRPDVLAARPWAAKTAQCGFAATFFINPNQLPNGRYTLRIRIQDDSGHSKELARPIVLAVGSVQPATFHPDYYRAWIARNEPDARELAAQREDQAALAYRPRISILTPVYNTPPEVLRETLRSVQEQTYPDWELCLVDGHSSLPHVREILQDFASRDGRISVRRLELNLGVAGNTNEALAMASGEFIALLDHDDTLAPFALYEVVKHLNAVPATDMLYSDEDRVSMDGTRHTFFFKPDWSPDLLQSFMYTGHLTVYRRKLVEELGGFRPAYDLSQDYDLALRVTERTQAIAHIPKVLYHWRTLEGSAAAGGKPHARITNIGALADAMRRRGYDAEVVMDPMANRVKFKAPPGASVSIIVPSDNPRHIHACVSAVLKTTQYPHYEVLVVTHSRFIPEVQARYAHEPKVRTVTYDEPFNFSLKCNRGVEQAKGGFVLFLNDDARPLDPEWLECMLGYFQQEGVGAVSPKLVYGNDTLQHAGMISGVRNLVGTAFHTLPRDTPMYFNMAQSTRTVSLLSAACLLMRKKVFEDVGGFDAVNTPIMHSDVDLCFKIREAGLRLVYTPFTTLEHVGHVSLGEEERKGNALHSLKSDIYLLKRWSALCAEDPYFPDNMREFLYFDSPAPYKMQPGARCERQATRYDILMASNDLSQSGAPLLLQVLASYLQQDDFVTVISPVGGKLLQRYADQKIPVIVDPLIMSAPDSLEKFISDFDVVVANTIFHWPLVLTARRLGKPVLWYVHEAEAGLKQAASNPNVARALAEADQVLFPGQMIVEMYRHFANGNHRAVLHGLPERKAERKALPQATDRIRVVHIGSIEPRKGQDVLIKAIKALGQEQRHFEFYFLGRILERPYYLEQLDASVDLDNVHWLGEIPAHEVIDYLASADVLACTSRDECLPLVVVDAFAQQRAVLATSVGMLPEVIESGRNGLLVKNEDAEGVAQALLRLKDKAVREQIAQAGRATYEKRLSYERYGREVSELIDTLLSGSSG